MEGEARRERGGAETKVFNYPQTRQHPPEKLDPHILGTAFFLASATVVVVQSYLKIISL